MSKHTGKHLKTAIKYHGKANAYLCEGCGSYVADDIWDEAISIPECCPCCGLRFIKKKYLKGN